MDTTVSYLNLVYQLHHAAMVSLSFTFHSFSPRCMWLHLMMAQPHNNIPILFSFSNTTLHTRGR